MFFKNGTEQTEHRTGQGYLGWCRREQGWAGSQAGGRRGEAWVPGSGWGLDLGLWEGADQGRGWGRKLLRKERQVYAHVGSRHPLSHKSWKFRVMERKSWSCMQGLPVLAPKTRRQSLQGQSSSSPPPPGAQNFL